MSLREALAARLHGIFWHGTPTWEACEPHEAERWRDLADECIRQMEWAREEAWRINMDDPPECICDVREYGSHRSDCHLAPLTLAPPDWTP